MPVASKSDQLFGEIALKNRLLTKQQVEDCLKALEKGGAGGKTFAEVVEKKSLLSSRAIASIARAQNYREVRLESKLYGRIAVKNKFAEVLAVKQCLEAQKKAYLKGEPPPDFGELLRARGQVTAEEDRAIREAMRKLDKESVLGKSKRAGDGGAAAAAAAAEGEAKAKGGSKKSGKVAAQGKGKKAEAAKKKTVGDSDLDDDLLLDDEDAQTADDGAMGDDTDAPLVAGSEGADVEGLLEEAAKAVVAPPAKAAADSASGISSSVSDRAVPMPPPPADELAADLAKPKRDTPKRGDDTNDLMDVVFAPGDLAPLGRNAAEAAEAKAEGAEAAAKQGAEAPAAKPANQPQATLSGGVAGVRDVTPAGGVPRLEVQGVAIGSGRFCPQCNVTLEPGLSECLYCGYKVPELTVTTPAPGKTSGRAAPAAGETRASGKQKGVGADPLAAEFDGLESLATCPRGELLRGKEKKGGAARLIWRLPAGVVPEAEQVAAFKADAAKVADLGLLHVLDLVRVASSAAATYAVYDDAAGLPAPARVKDIPFDRLRAGRATREVAACLAETSGAGVFARELRPEGVIFSDDVEGSPRIAGFGFARLSEPPAKGAVEPAGDAFVPPERVKKADQANVRTDLFGVGALLRLLLTGSGPTGKEPKDLPDVPGGLKMVLTKTLDPASGKRFLDFGKLMEELEKAPGIKGTKVETKR